jgi:hypothetical protein
VICENQSPDKLLVEVAKPKEFAYIFNILGCLPFFYPCNFDRVHSDSAVFQYYSQEFDFPGFKDAFCSVLGIDLVSLAFPGLDVPVFNVP